MDTRTGVADSTVNLHVRVQKGVEKKGRNHYTKEEDQTIQQYVNRILEVSPEVVSLSGNKLWQKMERNKITNRSWSSMRDRYLKHIRKKQESSESEPDSGEGHSPRRSKLPLNFINSTSDENRPSKRARRRVLSSSVDESRKRPDAAPVLVPEQANSGEAVDTRDVHQDMADFSDDSDMSNFDEIIVNLAESESETGSNATIDGTLIVNEGCPSKGIPKLVESGSKSETGTSATVDGTVTLNKRCPSEDIPKLAESGIKTKTGSDATVDGTVTLNEGCLSEDISKLAESDRNNETESEVTVDGIVTPNEVCPSEDIPKLVESGGKSETGTCATVDETVTSNKGCPSEDIPKLAESGSKTKTGSDATVDGTVTLNEGCSHEKIRKLSESSSNSETGSSATEEEITNKGQLDTCSLQRQMEKLSPEHLAVLDSVGSLRFRTKTTLAQIIHSLFCTNASLEDATAYLLDGNTENVWTFEDDNILMGQDEEAIHKLVESRGIENVESRILFLGIAPDSEADS